jgi:hypothetical protein
MVVGRVEVPQLAYVDSESSGNTVPKSDIVFLIISGLRVHADMYMCVCMYVCIISDK